MTDATRYCLQFNDFEKNVTTFMQEIQMDQEFCDITLACENTQIRAHKIIISAFSPVLGNILKMNNSQNSIIYLRGVSYEHVKNILTFIYEGKAYIDVEDISAFLDIAEDLKIRGLCQEEEKTTGSKLLDEQRKQNITYSNPLQKTQKDLNNENMKTSLELNSSISTQNKDKNFIDNSDHNNSFVTYNSQNEKLKQMGKSKSDPVKQSNNEKPTNCKKGIISEGKKLIEKLPALQNHTWIPFAQNNQSILNPSLKLRFEKEEIMKTMSEPESENNLNKLVNNIEDGINIVNSNACEPDSANAPIKRKKKRAKKSDFKKEEYYYKCNLCIYTAKRKYLIKVHERLEHKRLPYLCNQCDYKSDKKCHLTDHMTSFHGEHLPCNQCDYVAKRKKDLWAHDKSMHKADRISYPCDQCPHKATEKRHLRNHIAEVHEGLRYPCDQCDHKLSRKSNLILHVKRIHGGKYPCNQCQYVGRKKSSLFAHVKSIHEEYQRIPM